MKFPLIQGATSKTVWKNQLFKPKFVYIHGDTQKTKRNPILASSLQRDSFFLTNHPDTDRELLANNLETDQNQHLSEERPRKSNPLFNTNVISTPFKIQKSSSKNIVLKKLSPQSPQLKNHSNSKSNKTSPISKYVMFL